MITFLKRNMSSEDSPEVQDLTAKIAELGITIKDAKAEKKPKEEWEPALQEMLSLKVSIIF